MYDIETLRYLPQWMNCKYASSGSLLYTFWISALLNNYADMKRDLQDSRAISLYDTWCQVRNGWIAYTAELPSSTTTITFYTPTTTGTATRVSLYDFVHSTVPVFVFDDPGIILLRNLDCIETTTTPGSDFLVTLEPLVKDSDIWYKTGNAFERMMIGDSVDYSTGSIYFQRRVPTQIRYYPQRLTSSLNASGFIQINSNTRIPLTHVDLTNFWDDIGSLRGLDRLYDEDNYSYYLRQKSVYYINGGVQLARVKPGAARHLGLITTLQWCPSGALDLTTQGISDASEVLIPNLSKDSIFTENLQKISNNIYKSTYIPNTGSLYITVGGFLVSPASAVNNVITFYSNLSNSAVAHYQYTAYTTTRNSSGYITLVSPVSGNIDYSQSYTVYVSRAINAHTLQSTEYKSQIYNPDGTANSFLKEIANNITSSIKITLGEVSWEKANWFTDTDIKPELEYLPRSLD